MELLGNIADLRAYNLLTKLCPHGAIEYVRFFRATLATLHNDLKTELVSLSSAALGSRSPSVTSIGSMQIEQSPSVLGSADSSSPRGRGGW
jgi:hypothetical protein